VNADREEFAPESVDVGDRLGAQRDPERGAGFGLGGDGRPVGVAGLQVFVDGRVAAPVSLQRDGVGAHVPERDLLRAVRSVKTLELEQQQRALDRLIQAPEVEGKVRVVAKHQRAGEGIVVGRVVITRRVPPTAIHRRERDAGEAVGVRARAVRRTAAVPADAASDGSTRLAHATLTGIVLRTGADEAPAAVRVIARDATPGHWIAFAVGTLRVESAAAGGRVRIANAAEAIGCLDAPIAGDLAGRVADRHRLTLARRWIALGLIALIRERSAAAIPGHRNAGPLAAVGFCLAQVASLAGCALGSGR